MKKNILAPVFAALTIFFIYSSCTKIDTTDLGNELIPAVDNVNTFETVLDVVTDNLLFTESTGMQYNLDHAIGIIENDLDFGKTEAALYFDVAPPAFRTYPFTKKDSIVAVDSVVVSLTYKNLYGDSNSIQRFEVFEIAPTAAFRYSNTSDYKLDHPDFPVLPTPLGGRTVDFKTLNDSVKYINGKDTVRTINELRVQVNTSLANRFINADTTNAYRNDSIFKTYLKGLAVKINNAASPSKNALAYFDLTATGTRLTFYYRVKNNGKDSAVTTFFRYFSSNGDTTSSIGAQANLIKRTPAHGFLASITNTNPNDPKLYIQSMPGSYAHVRIPGIDTLTNRVIHRAEIIAEKLSPVSETFTTPDLLFIELVNAKGDSTFTVPNDFILTGTGTYDVNSIGGRLRNNRYVFNISRHLQNIVSHKKPNYTFRISAPFIAHPYYLNPTSGEVRLLSPFLVNPSIAKGRVIIAGGSHPTNRMRLRIIYSKI